jgi:hypothetical protein
MQQSSAVLKHEAWMSCLPRPRSTLALDNDVPAVLSLAGVRIALPHFARCLQMAISPTTVLCRRAPCSGAAAEAVSASCNMSKHAKLQLVTLS